MEETLLLSLAGIVVLGISAQLLAWRVGIPSILLLLVFGFIAGPILGIIEPDKILGETLFPLVSLAVAIILFEGGLTLDRREISLIGPSVRLLITVGAIVTWIVGTLGARYVIGLDWALATLLGAIVVVSGPTVVIPLLRHVRPSTRVASILKWEGILIDPVGAVLAVLVLETILADNFGETVSFIGIFGGIVLTLGEGLVLGFLGGWLIILLFQYRWAPHNLEIAVVLMVVIGVFALSNTIQAESGLMAVTVMGVVLANQERIEIQHIVQFNEEVVVLLLSFLFIILAARLELSELLALGWREEIFIAVLMLVGRPLSVLVSTIGSGLTWAEKGFLAWVAPRGIVAAAVASLFSLELAEHGIPGAELLVPVTFLVVVLTVAIYSLTAAPLAGFLNLRQTNPQGTLLVGAHPWARAMATTLQEAGFQAYLIDTNRDNVKAARLDGLTAVYGSILNDEILDRLPMESIGYMLALTSNNDLNAKAALRMRELVGPDHVFQLTAGTGKTPEVTHEGFHGHILFDAEMDFQRLNDAFEHGGAIKQTKLTEQFGYTAYQREYEGKAVPLFLVKPEGTLHVLTAQEEVLPRSGQTIIGLTAVSRKEAA